LRCELHFHHSCCLVFGDASPLSSLCPSVFTLAGSTRVLAEVGFSDPIRLRRHGLAFFVLMHLNSLAIEGCTSNYRCSSPSLWPSPCRLFLPGVWVVVGPANSRFSVPGPWTAVFHFSTIFAPILYAPCPCRPCLCSLCFVVYACRAGPATAEMVVHPKMKVPIAMTAANER
jgi:hypothetical protein